MHDCYRPLFFIFAVPILLCLASLSLIPALLVSAASAPVLINPPNLSTNVETTNIVFSWQKTGTTTDYKLDIATDANFNNLIFADFIGDSGTEYKLGIRLNANSTYYWRVTAAMPEISISSGFSFTTKAVQSVPPPVGQSTAAVPPANQANPSIPNTIVSGPQTAGPGKSSGASTPATTTKTKSISSNLPFIVAAAAIVIVMVTLFSILVLRRRKAASEYDYDTGNDIQTGNEYTQPPASLPATAAGKRPAFDKGRKDPYCVQERPSTIAYNPAEQVGVACTYCGFTDYPDNGICRNCGNEISSTVYQELGKEPQFFCPVCHLEVPGGMAACPSCKTPLVWG